MFFDSHFHPQLIPANQHAELFAKAKAAGVNQYLSVSLDIDDAAILHDLAQEVPGLYYSVGLHPCDVNLANCDKIKQCNLMHAVALGETGLDYYRGEVDEQQKALQKRSFCNHLDRARITGLPVIVHTREAEADTLEILRAYQGLAYGIIHCFTGSLAMARAAVELGWYISFSGIITMKSGKHLIEVAKQIPKEHMLIETDSPYLTPAPYYDRRTNMPAYVVEVAKVLHAACGITPETLTANTHRCLQII